MAATFLASTAILICLDLLGAAFRPRLFSEIPQALNLTGARNETLWMLVGTIALLGVLFRLDREAYKLDYIIVRHPAGRLEG